jgi:hypothetical protein
MQTHNKSRVALHRVLTIATPNNITTPESFQIRHFFKVSAFKLQNKGSWRHLDSCSPENRMSFVFAAKEHL